METITYIIAIESDSLCFSVLMDGTISISCKNFLPYKVFINGIRMEDGCSKQLDSDDIIIIQSLAYSFVVDMGIDENEVHDMYEESTSTSNSLKLTKPIKNLNDIVMMVCN